MEDVDINILGFEEIDYKIKQAMDRVLKEEEKNLLMIELNKIL